MDPITQGMFGALAAQSVATRQHLKKASVIGALSGMAPDLDTFIRSETDPLLYLEYHRHFTHSLFFVPIGGALCGLLLYALFGRRWQVEPRYCLWWSTVGLGTHGLLDACTSYGTQLLWPLSNVRVAWDLMSIIDPVFSGILMLLMILAVVTHRKALVAASCTWLVIYFSMAFIQHQRAINWGLELAQQRGHEPNQLGAKPSFGNILIWKVIYEYDGHFYVAAVKPGLGGITSWEGESIPKLDISRDFPWLHKDMQQARDIERFAHFSADHLAVALEDPLRIGDIRYSNLPHRIQPLWGIELTMTADPRQYAQFFTDANGRNRESFATLLEMLVE